MSSASTFPSNWPKLQRAIPVPVPVAPIKDAAKAVLFLFPKKKNG